jgi:hypothetical protein
MAIESPEILTILQSWAPDNPARVAELRAWLKAVALSDDADLSRLKPRVELDNLPRGCQGAQNLRSKPYSYSVLCWCHGGCR